MLDRGVALAVLVLAAACPLAGQAAPQYPYFVVCASQANLPSIYFSGVLQGPAASLPGFRTGFTQFLAQTYAYKGAVACAPAANATNAEKFLKAQTAALRNAKKNVVETGWVMESAAPVPTNAGMPNGGSGAAPQSAAAGGASAGSGASGTSTLTGMVTSALSSAFAQKPASAGTAAGAPTAPPAAAPSHATADGLGSAQGQNTRLVVYGCGRQDTQVACVSELTNQNQADTLMQSAELWKDAFIVDDRGDRHPRSRGFFLNIDGEQRTQIDVSYGKSARFVLVFDDVQPRVQKVALRSASGGLDVEDIDLITPAAATGPAH
jgi:hypothetical protein